MRFNLDKCAVQGEFDQDFLIQGRAIEACDVYEYLGFPMSAQGICFQQHAENRVTKARRALRMIWDLADGLPPLLKLSMVQVFVQPVWAYGLAFVATWEQAVAALTTQKVPSAYETIHRECIAWVLGFAELRDQWLPTMEAMTRIPSVAQRASELQTLMRVHIARAHPDNPIRLATPVEHDLQPDNVMVRLVVHRRSNALIREYEALPDPPTSLHEWLRTKLRIDRRRSFTASQGVLPRYLNLEAKCEEVLRMSRRKDRDKAMRWRINLVPSGTCPLATHRFTRACLNRCGLMQGILSAKDDDVRAFMEERRHRPPNFSLFDHLLNIGKISEFVALFDQIEEMIASG